MVTGLSICPGPQKQQEHKRYALHAVLLHAKLEAIRMYTAARGASIHRLTGALLLLLIGVSAVSYHHVPAQVFRG